MKFLNILVLAIKKVVRYYHQEDGRRARIVNAVEKIWMQQVSDFDVNNKICKRKKEIFE
jgi:hypothetical protein